MFTVSVSQALHADLLSNYMLALCIMLFIFCLLLLLLNHHPRKKQSLSRS